MALVSDWDRARSYRSTRLLGFCVMAETTPCACRCRTLQHECRDEAGPLCSHTSRNPGRRGSDESCKSSYSGHVPVESAPWGTQIQGWAWHANSLLPTAIVSPWHQTYTFERGRDLAERNRQREDQEIVPHSCAYACCSRARTPRRDVS